MCAGTEGARKARNRLVELRGLESKASGPLYDGDFFLAEVVEFVGKGVDLALV